MGSATWRGKSVVVIGSGLTGLAAGALLARQGARVTLLEKNAQALGGHARSTVIEGLRFSLGPQYVWSFGPGQIGRRVLRHLGLEQAVRFERMDATGFEQHRVGEGPWRGVPMGLDRLHAALCSEFPAEADGLRRFFARLTELFAAAMVVNERVLYVRGLWTMLAGVARSASLPPSVACRVARRSTWALGQLFDECRLSAPVRSRLYAHGGIFAESDSAVSAVVYAAATGYYHQGAYCPVDGFEPLVQGLAACIERGGGSVHRGLAGSAIEVERGRAAAVYGTDGSVWPADLVVSNLAPALTAGLLTSHQVVHRSYEPSNSLLTCLVGLRPTPGLREALRGRNLWWWRSEAENDFAGADATAPPRLLYVSSPTANGWGRTAQDPEGDSLTIFAPATYDQARRAADQGPEAHEQLRAAASRAVVAALDQYVLPGVAERVRFVKTLTPVDVAQATSAERGAVYGRRLTPGEVTRAVQDPWPLPNLVVACATVGLPGVATALNTAAHVVRQATGVEVP